MQPCHKTYECSTETVKVPECLANNICSNEKVASVDDIVLSTLPIINRYIK